MYSSKNLYGGRSVVRKLYCGFQPHQRICIKSWPLRRHAVGYNKDDPQWILNFCKALPVLHSRQFSLPRKQNAAPSHTSTSDGQREATRIVRIALFGVASLIFFEQQPGGRADVNSI